jgi:hypothetical protein
MFPVKTEGVRNCLLSVCGEAVGSDGAAEGWGWSAETTVDQTLICGLGPALRVFVSELSSV